jgi:hypothetical protein
MYRLLWELGGVAGVDPRELTWRELLLLAESRQREAWNHTSELMAWMANIHRGKKSRTYKGAELHPFSRRRRKKKEKLLPAPITVLKDLFCKPESGQ